MGVYKIWPRRISMDSLGWELRARKETPQRQTLAPSAPTVDMKTLKKLGKSISAIAILWPFSRRGPLR